MPADFSIPISEVFPAHSRIHIIIKRDFRAELVNITSSLPSFFRYSSSNLTQSNLSSASPSLSCFPTLSRALSFSAALRLLPPPRPGTKPPAPLGFVQVYSVFARRAGGAGSVRRESTGIWESQRKRGTRERADRGESGEKKLESEWDARGDEERLLYPSLSLPPLPLLWPTGSLLSLALN